MKKIGLYVWWSSGKGDGDGYDSEMEVTDEQYEVFKELDLHDEELDEIQDPRIKDVCQKAYDEEIDALKENSDIEDMMNEDDYIEPDDPDFWDLEDRDSGDQMVYRFTINVEQGESFVDYKLTKEEKELVYKAIDDGQSFEEIKELSDLFKRVNEAAKEKLQEDLDLTKVEDDFDFDDLEYSVSFDDYPEYEPRCLYTSDDYFDEVYSYGVRLSQDFYEEDK